MELNFDKMNGLIPAIIQDNSTRTVLMLGFMNQEAYQKTIETGKVTFFSRTRNQLWTKGETSGHYLDVVSISADCDQDTLLIKVNPHGPVCHTGADTCWNEKNEAEDIMFLKELQDFIDKRHEEMPEKSYTTSLFRSGVNKMAQKVGEDPCTPPPAGDCVPGLPASDRPHRGRKPEVRSPGNRLERPDRHPEPHP